VKEVWKMQKRPTELRAVLRNGFFLSSMMGVSDGTSCAQRSRGCAMVQLGAYLAEPTATAEDMGQDASSFLPADPTACTAFLAQECQDARQRSEVILCLNLAAPRLEWALEAGTCFAQAGGDLLELNVHGGYGRYLKQGKLRAMVQPEHQPELYRWVEALTGLEIPLIVKFHGQSDRAALLPVLDRMAELAPFGVHLNVRAKGAHEPDLALTQTARARYPGLLLVSGYVRSAADATALFEAGADMVGIAAPAMDDPDYIHKIATAYEAGSG
jgi:tRNA-dihydrouridine synthase